MKLILVLPFTVFTIYSLALGAIACLQRRFLYFPTHENSTETAMRLGLTKWEVGGEYTGYARLVAQPRKVWFFIHGNGGQAGERAYLFERISPQDAVYILEYPGYGERTGTPTRSDIDQAALKAYCWIVQTYGIDKIVVLGESLGSGPASQLAKAPAPPKHLVLVVPFDRLIDVAQENFRFLPVGLLMLDRWDNGEALKDFTGRVDIFGAKHDKVIPVHHARKLAASHPGALYHEFDGGHGWANGNQVDLSKM